MLNISIKYITLLLLAVSIISCSNKPTKEVTFDGRSVIKKGETATIKWHYKNADRVKVSGFNVSLNPIDSLLVSPNETKSYTIVASKNDEFDKDEWIVEVVKDEAQKRKALKKLNVTDKISDYTPETITDSTFIVDTETEEKPEIAASNSTNWDLKESTIETSLLHGITASNVANSLNLKISKITKSAEGYKINLLLLDNFGNFISNAAISRANINYANISGPSDYKLNAPELIKLTQATNYLFLAEKSYTDSNSMIGREIIKDNIAPLLNSDDNFSYYEFNQSYVALVDKKAKNQINSEEIEHSFLPKSLLTALYQNAFETANLLKKEKGNKNLVIINYGFDNASLVHTPKDLVQICQKNEIKVYFISIGNDIDSYTEREVCSQTGGRYYNIDTKEQIGDAIREITFANQMYYQLFISDNNLLGYSNPDLKIRLSMTANGVSLNENFKLPILSKLPNPGEKIIALFDLNSDVLSPKFEMNIDNMTKIFNENPEIPILLKGHTGFEGDLQNNIELSKRRAEKVKEKLISLGVKSEIIEPKGYADSRPLFPMETKDWQKQLNKRVSFKFLNTETKPFEIVAESAYSEAIALKKVEEWENRGYNAYYQRFTQNGIPGYLIKIWGFPTKLEASKTAQKIKDKFKIETEVDFE